MSALNRSPMSASQVEPETSKVAGVHCTPMPRVPEKIRGGSKRERRFKNFLIVLLRSFSMYVM